jgi:hypothetical protein
MVWFKIDDGFWSHPKVLELSDAAVALWTRAGSYCAGHLTNGTVKRSTLRVLAADRDAAVELVLAGLWDETPEGWTFHDWEVYQPTREQVEAERAAATERKRVSRERSRQKSQGESRRDARGMDAVIPGSPTRPDPTRPDLPSTPPDGVVEGAARERAASPFCPRHQPNGPSGKPCRGCGDARMAIEAMRAAEKARPTPMPSRPAECPEHPNWPLPCDKCAQIADEARAS